MDRLSGDSRRLTPFLIAETERAPAYPVSYPTVVARAENLNKHRQSLYACGVLENRFRAFCSDEGSGSRPGDGPTRCASVGACRKRQAGGRANAMRKEALRVGGTRSPTIRAAHLSPFAIGQ